MSTTSEQAEIQALRARVERLEAENAELAARANAAVAAAEDRVYWLDRWGLDLNALMRRRGAAEFRAAVRIVRAVVRRLQRVTARGAGVDVLEIPPAEFGHGRTRNLGAERTRAGIVAFLTQDAVPVPGWRA